MLLFQWEAGADAKDEVNGSSVFVEQMKEWVHGRKKRPSAVGLDNYLVSLRGEWVTTELAMLSNMKSKLWHPKLFLCQVC